MVQMLNFMVYVFYHNLKNISIGNRKKERVRGRERKEGKKKGRKEEREEGSSRVFTETP